MSLRFSLTPAPGDAWETACKGCGETYQAAQKSWIDIWRRHHRCPTPPPGGDA